VAYGKGLKAQSLSVSPKDLVDVLESDYSQNTVIELTVEGQGPLTVLLGEYQYHPVSRHLLHADFLQIDLNEPVEVHVPFELFGRSKGIVMGGTLRQVFRQLPVKCLPQKIPVKISHDITELDLDDHVAVKDLALPDGVTVQLAPARTVAAIITEKKRGPEDDETAEEGAEAATGEAAAKEGAAEKK
jgi:large subunit ribosomal protein L25